MNKTSHTNEPLEGDGFNQSPNPNSNDLTTNEDFNGLVNSRIVRESESQALSNAASNVLGEVAIDAPTQKDGYDKATYRLAQRSTDRGQSPEGGVQIPVTAHPPVFPPGSAGGDAGPSALIQRARKMLATFGSFIGPGFMVSVAYSKSTALLPRSLSFQLTYICSLS